MSTPSENTKINKTWGFTFTKDERNPLLLKFDNFDETKKLSSPAFFMAIYLRQHLKAIEEEIGKKPKEISFWITDQKLNGNERKRIKEGLEESCKLLKIVCSFIQLKNFEFDSREFQKV
uniref:Uncharacterized protein n=1 Tax=Panagrolaimus sp. PS1159 TaxID=55785 RepID=A0AC35G3C0_9BILA